MEDPPCALELNVPAKDVLSAINCRKPDDAFRGGFTNGSTELATTFDIRNSMYLDSVHVPHVFSLIQVRRPSDTDHACITTLIAFPFSASHPPQLWEYALFADCFAFFFVFASFIQVGMGKARVRVHCAM